MNIPQPTTAPRYVELIPADKATPANPAWHEARRAGVSASEIAAVLGLSPFESPFSLYWRKAEAIEPEANAEMDAGRRAEPVVADWWTEQHPDAIVTRAGLYAHPQRPWQLATPDRLVFDRCARCDGAGVLSDPGRVNIACSCQPAGAGMLAATLECKYLPGGWAGWGEPGSDDVPVYYRAQCLWQIDVMGVDMAHLAAWHGAEFRTYTIRRDEKDLRVLRQAAQEFLHRLAAGDPPPVDSATATAVTLRKLHPDVDDRDQRISDATAAGYRRARALKARASAMADLFEARLRAEMGPARRAVTADGTFIASRSIYTRPGYTTQPTTVDRLNPARSPK